MSLSSLDRDEDILDDCDLEQVLYPAPLPLHLIAKPGPEARLLGRPLLEQVEQAEGVVKPVLAEPSEVLREVPEATSRQEVTASEEIKTLWLSSVQFVEEDREEIDWLIPGVLPKGAVVLLSGREGTMKSFLALSMAHAVASGTPWLGRPTKQGRVTYLDGEMPKPVMQDRIRGFGTVEALGVCSWTNPVFPDDLGGIDLQRESQESCLIVIDTLRRHMDGLNENNSNDMARVTKKLRELKRYGATVLVLHHAPKDIENQDYRGSTELGAGVDVTATLTKKPTKTGAMLTLETRKTRYGSKCRLEIDATEGPRVPVLTIRGDQEPARNDLHKLALLINQLREQLGRDPIQAEIIKTAKDAGLGGKDSIRAMLKEGEGRYWREYRSGRPVSYAPMEG